MTRIIALLALFTCLSMPAFAAQSYEAWLGTMREKALKAGISRTTVDEALHPGVEFLPRVLELDRKQPEGSTTFAKYKARVINEIRIVKGREMMHRHDKILRAVEKKYGVPRHYIVALWGIETSYGSNMGGFDVIASLSTLAWEGRRHEFFTDELIKALRIIDQGHVTHTNMKGSWAGAMGQCQFMPSSFLNFAVDANGDGRKDIWGTHEDVFASIANYLASSGWKGDQRWGREVKIPHDFSDTLKGREVRKPISEWKKLGVTLPDGKPLKVSTGMNGSIIVPDGSGGRAWIVYDNYHVIMKWNRSIYFATSVGLLADMLIH